MPFSMPQDLSKTLNNSSSIPEKIASSINEEVVLDCDSDEVVLGMCCVGSILPYILTTGFCMDREEVIDSNPLICCCCLLNGDIKLTGPFCNGDPCDITWLDDGAIASDDGLNKPPI